MSSAPQFPQLDASPSGQTLLVPGSRKARIRAVAWFLASSVAFGGIAALNPHLPIPAVLRFGCAAAGILLGFGAAYVSMAYGPRLTSTRFSFSPQGHVIVTGANGKVLQRCAIGHPTLELRADSGSGRFWFAWAHGRASIDLLERDYRILQGLGVRVAAKPPPGREAHRHGRSSLIMWSMVALGALALPSLAIYQRVSPSAQIIEARPPEVAGSFRSDDLSLGKWELSPIHCLSGRERGFRGVAFLFARDSIVRELRLDTERNGDNLIQIVFFDSAQTSVQIRERECELIDGRIRRELLEINGRDVEALKGKVKIDCPARGLRGNVTFDGCLPKLL